MDLLLTLGADRTLLLISHRLLGLERMDRVALMEEGRIRLCAPHQELLEDDHSRSCLLYPSRPGALSGWRGAMSARRPEPPAGRKRPQMTGRPFQQHGHQPELSFTHPIEGILAKSGGQPDRL